MVHMDKEKGERWSKWAIGFERRAESNAPLRAAPGRRR
jgi:hypothetical protein